MLFHNRSSLERGYDLVFPASTHRVLSNPHNDSRTDPHTTNALQIVTPGELHCQFAERTFADEGLALQTIKSRIEVTSVSAVILRKVCEPSVMLRPKFQRQRMPYRAKTINSQ